MDILKEPMARDAHTYLGRSFHSATKSKSKQKVQLIYEQRGKEISPHFDNIW